MKIEMTNLSQDEMRIHVEFILCTHSKPLSPSLCAAYAKINEIAAVRRILKLIFFFILNPFCIVLHSSLP